MLEKKSDDTVDFDVSQTPGVETDVDLEKARIEPDGPQLTHEQSHVSHHELHGAVSHHVEADAAQYERFSNHKKVIITCVLSLCGFLAPISSTTILAAIPEVAAEFNSTGTIINLSNALYLVFMGISPCFWGPLSGIYGRRWVRTTGREDCDSRKLTSLSRSAFVRQRCSSPSALALPLHQTSRPSSHSGSSLPSKGPRS